MLPLGLFLSLLFGHSFLHYLFALCIRNLYRGCQYVDVYIFGNDSSYPISVPSQLHCQGWSVLLLLARASLLYQKA